MASLYSSFFSLSYTLPWTSEDTEIAVTSEMILDCWYKDEKHDSVKHSFHLLLQDITWIFSHCFGIILSEKLYEMYILTQAHKYIADVSLLEHICTF